MQFKVTFTSGHGKNYVLHKHSRSLGLYDVDRIRNTLEVPGLPLEKISPILFSYSRTVVDVFLTERQARQVGDGFWCSNTVRVEVPEKSLNKYVVEVLQAEKNKETGEVEKAWVEYSVDKDRLIRDWLSAGAPKEWNPADENPCRPLEDDEIEECY